MKLNKAYYDCTDLVKSSEQIASHRFNEELFLRIPLKAFGGFGKFGRWKLLILIELDSCSCKRDFRKASSLMPTNGSGETPYKNDISWNIVGYNSKLLADKISWIYWAKKDTDKKLTMQ